MNLFRRLSATVVSRIDEAVRGIENHDAVVGASLEDLRRALAEARVRHQRTRSAIEQQAHDREARRAEAEQWRERAARGDCDEATALECLKRARAADRRVTEIDAALERQRAAAEKLQRAVERLERRHRELEGQRRTLRGREAAARAADIGERMEAAGDDSLQETLDRWEIDVATHELADSCTDGDELAERFEAAETDADLRAELAELRGRGTEG